MLLLLPENSPVMTKRNLLDEVLSGHCCAAEQLAAVVKRESDDLIIVLRLVTQPQDSLPTILLQIARHLLYGDEFTV